jgi:hypothetical protein
VVFDPYNEVYNITPTNTSGNIKAIK